MDGWLQIWRWEYHSMRSTFWKCKILLVVSVSGSQDWKSLKGVKEGLSLRFTIVPTEVDFNENRAVIYWYAFLAPQHMEVRSNVFSAPSFPEALMVSRQPWIAGISTTSSWSWRHSRKDWRMLRSLPRNFTITSADRKTWRKPLQNLVRRMNWVSRWRIWRRNGSRWNWPTLQQRFPPSLSKMRTIQQFTERKFDWESRRTRFCDTVIFALWHYDNRTLKNYDTIL